MKKKTRRPIYNIGSEREKSLMEDTPATFEIVSDPKNIKWDLWDEIRTFDSYGRTEVNRYDRDIQENAKKHNIDPDLIRSVMYAENARGHKIILNRLADKVGLSDSILPMNIQKNRWAKIIDKNPEDMYDSNLNIEASTVLLKRIRDRIEKPTPEKIGTIWNSSERTKTSVFGEYIGKVYHEKPWTQIDDY